MVSRVFWGEIYGIFTPNLWGYSIGPSCFWRILFQYRQKGDFCGWFEVGSTLATKLQYFGHVSRQPSVDGGESGYFHHSFNALWRKSADLPNLSRLSLINQWHIVRFIMKCLSFFELWLLFPFICHDTHPKGSMYGRLTYICLISFSQWPMANRVHFWGSHIQ